MPGAEGTAAGPAFAAIAVCVGLLLVFLLVRRIRMAQRARRQAPPPYQDGEEIYRNFQRGRVLFAMTLVATVLVLAVSLLVNLR